MTGRKILRVVMTSDDRNYRNGDRSQNQGNNSNWRNNQSNQNIHQNNYRPNNHFPQRSQQQQQNNNHASGSNAVPQQQQQHNNTRGTIQTNPVSRQQIRFENDKEEKLSAFKASTCMTSNLPKTT